MTRTALLSLLLLACVACGQEASTSQPAALPPTTAPTRAPTQPPATPTPAALTNDSIMASLQKSGLPIADVVAYTSETDPNKLLGRPNQYAIKVSWTDTRVPELNPLSSKPTIEVFTSAPALAAWKQYIEALGTAGPLFAQYVYVNEARMALCRVPRDFTPEQAKDYERWLGTL